MSEQTYTIAEIEAAIAEFSRVASEITGVAVGHEIWPDLSLHMTLGGKIADRTWGSDPYLNNLIGRRVASAVEDTWYRIECAWDDHPEHHKRREEHRKALGEILPRFR